jgi:hypothetical protein
MVTDMGCHLTTISQHHHATSGNPGLSSDIEREWRRRLYWGALVTDATQSLYLGRQMTLRPAEGRVPPLFLDSYEELEEWKPYLDELQPSISQSVLSAYQPKPAFAVSTFTELLKLAQISASITQSFYSMDCLKRNQSDLSETKASLETDLRRWKEELPVHLRFEPGVDGVPPPHQITPQ